MNIFHLFPFECLVPKLTELEIFTPIVSTVCCARRNLRYNACYKYSIKGISYIDFKEQIGKHTCFQSNNNSNRHLQFI